MTTHAVLTGDFVRSSDLDERELDRARQTLMDALGQVAGWQPKLVPATPDIFRGDSWQLLLSKPGYCLRAAFYVRACLKAASPQWDTRIAVGLGRVSKISRERTSLSTGEAFLISGRALDAMVPSTNLVVATPENAVGWRGLSIIAQTCSILVDDWSQKQAQLARLALPPGDLTQAEMADQLGITQQGVSKAYTAARIANLLAAAQYCETLNWRRLEFI